MPTAVQRRFRPHGGAAIALVSLVAAAVASAAPPLRGHTEVPDLAAQQAHVPVALAFFGERRGLLARADGTLLATKDGGSSWRPAGRLALEHFDVLSSTLAFATTKRALLRTDDAGAHWRLVAHVGGAVSFADRLHGWIVSRGAFATDDGGRTLRPLHVSCGVPPNSWTSCSRSAASRRRSASPSAPASRAQARS